MPWWRLWRAWSRSSSRSTCRGSTPICCSPPARASSSPTRSRSSAALGWRRDHVAWLFFYGILLFSGSLYMRALGAAQPVLILGALGALLLLLGWLALAWSSLVGSRA